MIKHKSMTPYIIYMYTMRYIPETAYIVHRVEIAQTVCALYIYSTDLVYTR